MQEEIIDDWMDTSSHRLASQQSRFFNYVIDVVAMYAFLFAGMFLFEPGRDSNVPGIVFVF